MLWLTIVILLLIMQAIVHFSFYFITTKLELLQIEEAEFQSCLPAIEMPPFQSVKNSKNYCSFVCCENIFEQEQY